MCAGDEARRTGAGDEHGAENKVGGREAQTMFAAFDISLLTWTWITSRT